MTPDLAALVPPKYDELITAWLSAIEPPPVETPADWAEANLYLPSDGNSEPGELVLSTAQRGVLDATVEPGVHTIVLCGASQSGKSLTMDARTLWEIAQQPGPSLVVHPTDAKGTQWKQDRFDPLVKKSKALRELIGGGRKGGGDNKAEAKYPGGRLAVASAHKPDDLAARAVRWLKLDEVDRFPASAGREGNPIRLATKRTETYASKGQSLTMIASTPVRMADSNIWTLYLRGDQRKFFCTCESCGAEWLFAFDNVKWSPGKPETARLQCPHCEAKHDEQARTRMLESGEWQATAEGERGLVSFHWSALVSKFASLQHIVSQFESIKTTQDRITFVNTVLAEPIDNAELSLDLESGSLHEPAVKLTAPYELPIDYVVAGADVQANRIEVLFFAELTGGRSAILDHVILSGDTHVEPDLTANVPTVWNDFDRLLGRTFKLKGGAEVPIAACAVDSQYNTQRVAEFTFLQQRKRQRRVFPIKGMPQPGRLHIEARGKLRDLTRLHLVGTYDLKIMLYRRLMIDDATQSGHIVIADHMDAAFYDGLAAEQFVTEAKRNGDVVSRWKPIAGIRNEPLDCLVYAAAMSTLVAKPYAARKARAAAEKQAPQKTYADAMRELNDISNGRGTVQ